VAVQGLRLHATCGGVQKGFLVSWMHAKHSHTTLRILFSKKHLQNCLVIIFFLHATIYKILKSFGIYDYSNILLLIHHILIFLHLSFSQIYF